VGDDRPKEKEEREPCWTGEGKQKVNANYKGILQKIANSSPSLDKHQ